jgi:hypothetical protein
MRAAHQVEAGFLSGPGPPDVNGQAVVEYVKGRRWNGRGGREGGGRILAIQRDPTQGLYIHRLTDRALAPFLCPLSFTIPATRILFLSMEIVRDLGYRWPRTLQVPRSDIVRVLPSAFT